MKIKVCGMKYPENISAVAALQPDYMGFIFYPQSPRFASELEVIEVSAIRTGVFVDENEGKVKKLIGKKNIPSQ